MFKDKGILKALWAGMFIVCGVLGFISQPGSAAKVLMIILSVLFLCRPLPMCISASKGRIPLSCAWCETCA